MIALLVLSILVVGVHGFAENAHLCDQINSIACATQYTPGETNEVVCGSDGMTYLNYCFYSQARCATPTTHIVSVGPCGVKTTPTTIMATTAATAAPGPSATAPMVTDTTMAPITTMAAGTTTTGTTTVGTTTVDTLQQVFCSSKDNLACGTDLDPVCGSDKVFYLNKCEFTKAICSDSTLVAKAIDFCT